MRVQVEFKEHDKRIGLMFEKSVVCFPTKFEDFIESTTADLPYYEGDYSVTPSIAAQTVPTANKYLTEDITVEAIPYSEVSNFSGGKTVTIA